MAAFGLAGGYASTVSRNLRPAIEEKSFHWKLGNYHSKGFGRAIHS